MKSLRVQPFRLVKEHRERRRDLLRPPGREPSRRASDMRFCGQTGTCSPRSSLDSRCCVATLRDRSARGTTSLSPHVHVRHGRGATGAAMLAPTSGNASLVRPASPRGAGPVRSGCRRGRSEHPIASETCPASSRLTAASVHHPMRRLEVATGPYAPSARNPSADPRSRSIVRTESRPAPRWACRRSCPSRLRAPSGQRGPIHGDQRRREATELAASSTTTMSGRPAR